MVEVVAAGGQHDHRGRCCRGCSRRHTSKPSHAPGKHHIEHDDIHRTLTQAVQRRLTGRGGGGARPITEPAQRQLQALAGQAGVVLD